MGFPFELSDVLKLVRVIFSFKSFKMFCFWPQLGFRFATWKGPGELSEPERPIQFALSSPLPRPAWAEEGSDGWLLMGEAQRPRSESGGQWAR